MGIFVFYMLYIKFLFSIYINCLFTSLNFPENQRKCACFSSRLDNRAYLGNQALLAFNWFIYPVDPSVGPCPPHFWITSVFCITAPVQPSATGAVGVCVFGLDSFLPALSSIKVSTGVYKGGEYIMVANPPDPA